jgi:hypothetical protein
MDYESKQRYIRWQDYRIKQLSFSINLFLGFAIASLGFAINLLLSGKIQNPAGLRLIIVLWAISALLGSASTITRVWDFRYTARKIKHGGQFNTFMAKYCGPATWATFWCQIVCYAIGSYLFITTAINMTSLCP